MKILTKETEGLKVLVLSDLHIFTENDIKKVELLLDKIKSNNYDAIYLVGDIIDSTNALKLSREVNGRLLELTAFLGHIAPTYIVYGSHDLAHRSIYDSWIDDEKYFKREFLNKIAGYHNINVLENETKSLKAGTGYTISGINPSLDYAMKTPDGNERILLHEIDKYEFLTKLDPTNTNTLLCHYPQAIMSLYNAKILKNIDLSVAGHNHNGCTQFKFIPVELFLNLFRQNNRGLITPGKSLNLKDTEKLRGSIELGENSKLLINPAFKTFASCTGKLEKLDWMFYRGYSEIEYVPEENLSR